MIQSDKDTETDPLPFPGPGTLEKTTQLVRFLRTVSYTHLTLPTKREV